MNKKKIKDLMEQLWNKQADLMEKMTGDRNATFPIAEDDMKENYDDEEE